MGEVEYTMLDGPKEERMRILRDFFGLKEGQTFQDIGKDEKKDDDKK